MKRQEVNDKHNKDASSQHSDLVVQPPSSKTSITFPTFIDSAFPELARNQMETSKVTEKSIFTMRPQIRIPCLPPSVLRTRRATTNDARASEGPKRATQQKRMKDQATRPQGGLPYEISLREIVNRCMLRPRGRLLEHIHEWHVMSVHMGLWRLQLHRKRPLHHRNPEDCSDHAQAQTTK